MEQTIYFEDYEIGSVRESIGRTITETDIVIHAGQTGDCLLYTSRRGLCEGLRDERRKRRKCAGSAERAVPQIQGGKIDMKPLEGMIVLDFSQYLAGPSAALRLADLGARVIKIERPGSGDGSRPMKLHNLESMGDSVLFQTINRNKESFCANLKSPEDMAMVKRLIARADVMIENFRPGVMKKMGLDYESVRRINPRLVYGTVTGYGTTGPWIKKPGQDLLVQSISGLAWLNGDDGQPPMPFALSLADSYTGIHLAEGIMACLLRRFTTGQGGLVEVSLLESVLDLQFEVITTYLNDGHQPPKRSAYHNAHAYLSAPYGIYGTSDGYIALAMGSVPELGGIIGCSCLLYTSRCV